MLLAQKAWHQIRGMGLELEYVPEDLRFMLEEEASWRTERDSAQILVDHYFDFLHALDAAADEEELFHRAVRRLSQILGAERGALFWTTAKGSVDTLELRAGHNFTKTGNALRGLQAESGIDPEGLHGEPIHPDAAGSP